MQAGFEGLSLKQSPNNGCKAALAATKHAEIRKEHRKAELVPPDVSGTARHFV